MIGLMLCHQAVVVAGQQVLKAQSDRKVLRALMELTELTALMPARKVP